MKEKCVWMFPLHMQADASRWKTMPGMFEGAVQQSPGCEVYLTLNAKILRRSKRMFSNKKKNCDANLIKLLSEQKTLTGRFIRNLPLTSHTIRLPVEVLRRSVWTHLHLLNSGFTSVDSRWLPVIHHSQCHSLQPSECFHLHVFILDVNMS